MASKKRVKKRVKRARKTGFVTGLLLGVGGYLLVRELLTPGPVQTAAQADPFQYSIPAGSGNTPGGQVSGTFYKRRINVRTA